MASEIESLREQLAKEQDAHQATARALVDACAQRDTNADQVAALRAALAELVAAGDYAVTSADDIRIMLRLGAATDIARQLLAAGTETP